MVKALYWLSVVIDSTICGMGLSYFGKGQSNAMDLNSNLGLLCISKSVQYTTDNLSSHFATGNSDSSKGIWGLSFFEVLKAWIRRGTCVKIILSRQTLYCNDLGLGIWAPEQCICLWFTSSNFAFYEWDSGLISRPGLCTWICLSRCGAILSSNVFCGATELVHDRCGHGGSW